MDEAGDFITQHSSEQPQSKCDKTGMVSSNGNGDASSLNLPTHRTGSSTYRISSSGSDILRSPIQPAFLNSGIFSQKCAKRPEALRMASIRQELRSDFHLQEQLRTECIKNPAAFVWPYQSYRNETSLNDQSVSAAPIIRSSVDHCSSHYDSNDQFPAMKEESVHGFGNFRSSKNLDRVHVSQSATKQADGFPRLDALAEPSVYMQQEQPQQLNSSSCRNSLPPSLSASFEMHQARLKKGVAHKQPSRLPNITETAIQRTPIIAEHFRSNGAVENIFQLKLPGIQGVTKYNIERTLDVQEDIGNQGHLQGVRKKRRNLPKAPCKSATLKKKFDESDDLTSTGYPSGCSSRNSSVHDDDSNS